MIFPMVSSVNGFPASGLHADSLKQPGQCRVHPAHPDGSPEPWAVRDVAPQHLHMPAHQRPLPLLSRRTPLSATKSITSVRVSSLECLITLSCSPPSPDFAHKPMPVFPVEGDLPVSDLSLCLHVFCSSECADIYDVGLSASLGRRSCIVRRFTSALAADGSAFPLRVGPLLSPVNSSGALRTGVWGAMARTHRARAEAAEALKSPGQSARPESEAPVAHGGRRAAEEPLWMP